MQLDVLISADSHVSEPLELWRDQVDRRFRDRAPQHVLNPKDLKGSYFIYEGLPPHPISVGIAAGQTHDQLLQFIPDATYADGRPGGWDPAARLVDNERDHIVGDVLYTTLGMRIFSLRDAALQKECFRVYNNWLSEYCSYSPGKMVGLALISLYDVKAGAEELQRCAAKGLGGAMIWCSPPEDLPFTSREYDYFWRAAEEMECPISLHALTGMGRESHWEGYTTDTFDLSALTRSTMLHAEIERSLNQIIFSGVLERFPKLRFVSAENGCGWLPYYLQRVDAVYRSISYIDKFKLSMRPTDYFRRQIYCTFIEDQVGVYSRHLIGVGNVMWSSDYPHGVSTWPHSLDSIQRSFVGVSDAERHRMTFGNASSIYRFEL